MGKILQQIKKNLKRSKTLTKMALYFKKKLTFFYLIPKCDEEKHFVSRREDVFFERINDYFEFIKICKQFKIPIDKHNGHLRFENGCKFYFLHNQSEYLTYGWSIEGENFFLINYLNVKVKIGEKSVILFDFLTNPVHRCQGYYKIILSHIIEKLMCKSILIYTSPSNIGSTKGILANNFKDVGAYSKFTINKCFKKLKKNNLLIKKTKVNSFVY